MNEIVRKRRDPLGNLASGYIAVTAIGITLGLLTYWASVAIVETSVRADGNVIPIGLNRRAQYLEGGIVKELLAKEGDHVKTGQILIKIAPEQINSDRGERDEKIMGLQAQIVRLSAEAKGLDEFPEPANNPYLKNEKIAFIAARNSLKNRVKALEEQEKRAILDANSKKAQLEGLSLQELAVQRSVNLQKEAFKNGGGSQGRLVEFEAQLAGVHAQMAPIPDAILADEAGASEARARKEAEIGAWMSESAQKLGSTQAELSSLIENNKMYEDRLKRTDVLSPVDGIIQKIYVNNVGEVVPPDSTVADIVPIEDGLVVEAHIKPEDIRGIHTGMRALIRLSAYDVSRYGTLEGSVITTSPDITKEERTGQTYYRVRIKTDKSEIGGEPIKIGMSANVNIITGERTILNYLTSPITDWSKTALRER